MIALGEIEVLNSKKGKHKCGSGWGFLQWTSEFGNIEQNICVVKNKLRNFVLLVEKENPLEPPDTFRS